MSPINQTILAMKGTICGFKDQQIGSQLMIMGVNKGSQFKVMGKSPFGNSYLVKVDNRSMAMGWQEINSITLL